MVLLLAVVACEPERSALPAAELASNPGNPGTVGGTTAGAAGEGSGASGGASSGGSTSGGTAGTGASTAVDVFGQVQDVSGPLLTNISAKLLAAKLSFDGANGEQVLATATGNDDFRASGVLAAADAYVLIKPTGAGYVDTINAIDTRGGASLRLLAVTTDLLDSVTSGLGLPFDRAKSMARLQFVDSSGAGASGVTVSAPAGTAFYSSGGVLLPDGKSTDSAGVVFVMNVPSAPSPGASVALTVTRAGTSKRLPLRLANGVLTLARVEL